MEIDMKKTILLTAILGCSALWAGAQQSSTMPDAQSGAPPAASASGQSGAGQSAAGQSAAGQSATGQSAAGQSAGQAAPSTSAGNPVTVEGCLAGSGENYTLKDKTSGVTYKLSGDTAKLAPYIGKELQLTGTTATANAGGAASATSAASAGSSMPTLNMMSGKASSTPCSGQ
jgi:hypothetical protein